jgi:hypothetical protein
VYKVFAPYLSSYPLFLPLPSSHCSFPSLFPHRICSALLFSDFVKKKEKRNKWHCFLFVIKAATQGAFLWGFHVHMYYSSNWFISSIFLHFT